jgi:hypothetical protein
MLYTGTFTENITGGLIRTVGDLLSASGMTYFTPEGGAVEMYGSVNSQISLPAGCYFHDLYSAKTLPAVVSPSSNLTIKGELKVKSSTFNSGTYLIIVGE